MPAQKNHFDYDVAVLGGGSAGYAAAAKAAAEELKVAVLEGGERVGGLCILRGCMPSKALLHAAEVLHTARMGERWGLRIPKAGFDFPAVMAKKNSLIDGFARYRHKQLAAGKFKFIRATAHFTDKHTLQLTPARRNGMSGVPKTLTAKNFVVATGSTFAPPPSPALKEIGYLTSDDALALKAPPKSLIVLGGGAVAVEMAQFYRRMDVEVTLIQRGEHLLREFDIDAAEAVARALRREGIEIYSDTRILDAFCEGRKKGVAFTHRKRPRAVTADEILVATGRSPNTADLVLENAGVTQDFGRIVTNAEMRTSQQHIYAAGDCTGPFQIVHIGIEQGEIAAHNIAHPKKLRHIDYRLLTNIVFTSPQAAFVGLTERAASQHSVPFFTASYPFNDHGKSLIMEAKEGFVKLLANPATGEILGGACVGPMGGELLHEIVAAMYKRMTVHELAAMPHYHPTLAEIWTYPAAELAERIKVK